MSKVTSLKKNEAAEGLKFEFDTAQLFEKLLTSTSRVAEVLRTQGGGRVSVGSRPAGRPSSRPAPPGFPPILLHYEARSGFRCFRV